MEQVPLNTIPLPAPDREGSLPVESALQQRRSVRHLSPASLSLPQVAQLLWAAQGITDDYGFRTAPSAGALYPLEVYLVAGAVEQLPAGLYHYNPKRHELTLQQTGDFRKQLSDAAFQQHYVHNAPAVLVITGIYARTAHKYGARAKRYVHIEAGSVAQNVYLQVTSLGLGTVYVGAFDDSAVQQVLGLPADHEPMALMPIGQLR
jgi:SagB-type dehydrogenase family enzyme